MKWSRVSPARIARALSVTLFLTFFQVVVTPVIAPQISTPIASAADANDLPAGLGTVYQFLAESYTSGSTTWPEARGGTAASITNNATKVTNSANTLGASKSVVAVQGFTTTDLTFPTTIGPGVNSNYTMLYVARYAPPTGSAHQAGNYCDVTSHSTALAKSRIFTSISGNWLTGFWACAAGVAYHEGWLTDYLGSATELSGNNGNNWLLASDCGYTVASTSSCKGKFRAFGNDARTTAPSVSTASHQVGVNVGAYGTEASDFQIAEVISYPTILPVADLIKVETYLARKYGITLSSSSATKLGIHRASVGTNLNEPFSVQPQIAVQDANGQTVTTNNGTIITATVTGLNGKIIGAATADTVQGVATFENLGIDGLPSNSYTITYSSNGGHSNTSETRTFTRGGGSETDTALTLNGTNQYAEKTEAGATPFDLTGDVTLQAWVYPTTDCPSDQAIVAKLNSYMMYCGSGVWKYVYDADGAAWGGSNSTIKVIKNEWHHIAFSKSGTTMSIYMDGNVVQTVTGQTASMSPNNDAFQIGRYGTSSYFQGELDEVRVYNSARTQNQIQTDMHNYGSISDANLIAYYDFNEGFGSTLFNRDFSATSATDLTVYGSPLWTDVKLVNTTVYSAYTIVKFDRTYLTSAGGWRAPTNVSAVSALIVGGGGGGGWNSGGGGAGGGFLSLSNTNLAGILRVKVGTGGRGGQGPDNNSVPTYVPAGGESTILGSNEISGGNKGGVYASVTYGGSAGGASIVTSSGSSGVGGAGATSNGSPAAGGGAGLASTIESTTTIYYSMGGGGGGWNSNGGAPGGSTTGATGGGSATLPGSGGGSGTSTSPAGMGLSGKASTGGGGGASSARVDGGNGGSGVIIVRWITAAKPIFTQPAIDTTTAGLTDTITVSANPLNPLTRNYRWQVSTDTGTTWANASTGSGLTSNTYTTPILETNTSGIRYQYRVIVTDSDTAGLFIVDTSTAVYIVINPRISYSGNYSSHKYGSTHQDTFTVLNGTGNKTLAYSPNNRTGITWSSPSTNTAVLTIGATLFVGTYFETITATDAKGAQTSLGLSIVVSKADTITVTTIARTETFTGSTLSFTPAFTVSGLKNSDTVTAGAMNWYYNGVENSGSLYAIQTTRPTNAGSYIMTPITPASLTDSYTAVSIVPAALTVNRATRTLTATAPASPLKFGETRTITSSLSAGSGDGTLTYATSTTDSCTVSSTTIQAIKSSGTCAFTAQITRGNNYETATATAVTTTLTKADTLTVTVNSMAPITYTGAQIGITPSVTVSGLKLTNNVGATPATIKYASSGNPAGDCASGGACALGDTGPGGGTVFYDAGSQQSWGRYLEIAKSGWSGSAGETTAKWCSTALSNSALNIVADGIGQGLANSTSIANSCGAGAAYLARNHNGGGKTNWYLPTPAEFVLMYNARSYIDLSTSTLIWLSTEANDANMSWVAVVGALSSSGLGGNNKADVLAFRPIRAFAAGDTAQNFVTTKPIDADTYTVRASDLTLSVGSLSDYQGVTYIDASLRVNRAQQSQLFLAEYGATLGVPYKVIVFGGSGTGASRVTATSGTATGCAVSGDTLTTTSVGTCVVTAVKAQDKNYETATVTINVYFLEFVIQQPAPPVSTGPGIALSGVTSLTLDPYQAPTISSISISTGRVGDIVTINGAGFTASALQSVKFWRNVVASIQGTPTNTQIVVLVPAGATTGKILVTTANGSAITEGNFTVDTSLLPTI